MTKRVLIADDHVGTRQEIRAALEAAGFTVCAETGEGGSAVELAKELEPDICLLDILMPGGGIQAARFIHRALPDTAIVMLTVSRDDEHLFDALKAGASGYLTKDIPHDRVAKALEGVLAGEAALPRALTTRLLDEFRRRRSKTLRGPTGEAVRLTEREWETLELMGDGLSTKEIAERTFVAAVTVRTHIAAILKKLQVGSREEAIALMDHEDPPGDT